MISETYLRLEGKAFHLISNRYYCISENRVDRRQSGNYSGEPPQICIFGIILIETIGSSLGTRHFLRS